MSIILSHYYFLSQRKIRTHRPADLLQLRYLLVRKPIWIKLRLSRGSNYTHAICTSDFKELCVFAKTRCHLLNCKKSMITKLACLWFHSKVCEACQPALSQHGGQFPLIPRTNSSQQWDVKTVDKDDDKVYLRFSLKITYVIRVFNLRCSTDVNNITMYSRESS